MADRNLLPGLAKNKGRDVNDRKTHQATANMGDAATVFKFAADNSEVEWKLDVYVGDDGRFAILGNNMTTHSVSQTNELKEAQSKEQIIDIHSHPSGGTKGGSDQDKKVAEMKKTSVKIAVYSKDNSTLYEYTSKKSNSNNIPIKDALELLKYISK